MHPSSDARRSGRFRRILLGLVIVGVVAVAGSMLTGRYFHNAAQATQNAAAAEAAVAVTVAVVEPRSTSLWDEFSGRLEAVERVEVRSRVAGAVQSAISARAHWSRRATCCSPSIPRPMRPRSTAQAQVAAAKARVLHRQRARTWRAACRRNVVSQRDSTSAPTRIARPTPTCTRPRRRCNGQAQPRLHPGARAGAGRVGKLEITVGNLVAAGPAPVLTTLVSVSPIYASFDADEQVVLRAMRLDRRCRRRAASSSASRCRCRHRRQRRPSKAAPAADRQPGRREERHGARARRVRQRGRPPDARPVRAAAHGPGEAADAAAGQRARGRHRPETRSS